MQNVKHLFILGTLLLQYILVKAQNPLQKNISIQANKQRLANVLEIMSNTGNFNFSYNSSIIRKDSLVTLSFSNRPVNEILNYIFNNSFEFIESGNYIIIRRKPISIKPLTAAIPIPTADNNYYVTGYIIDEETGEKLDAASVYEAEQLASDLSDEKGYFKLKLKSKYKTASLTVSKLFYNDTTITILPKLNQALYIFIQKSENDGNTVKVSPEDYFLPDSVEVTMPSSEMSIYSKVDSIKVQKSWIGKFLLSSRQKIQSVNLKNFFAKRNFQLALVPGLSTQGKLSSQVTNNFSLNALGGYTRSINVIEIAGLFNINKKDVKSFQAAGLFNTVGGRVKGFQLAGIQNLVFDSVSGFQTAGISNYVKGKFSGLQVAGIYNHQSDSIKGLQIGGIANFSKNEIVGVQIAGIVNYTKKLKGLQIGLINIADSSEGYSIGLFNFVKSGYHKICISTNELSDLNLAFKSGNRKLYSIIQVGTNFGANNKLYAFGYGIGRENKLNNKLSLVTELSYQYLYAGSWDYHNMQNKFALSLQWQPTKRFSVFAGPSFSVFASNQKIAVPDYKFPMPTTGYKIFDNGSNSKGWLGFTVGVNLL